MSSQKVCLVCKSPSHGVSKCPYISRLPSFKISAGFSGSSPPSVFVGRANYPHVQAGIFAPTEVDRSAWRLDAPNFWYDNQLQIPSIVNFRTSMVLSQFSVNVRQPSKTLEVFNELALAEETAEVELKLKRVQRTLKFDHVFSPFGPTAEIERAKLTENPYVPRPVEDVVSDEMNAAEALTSLYSRGIDVYHLQRLLSAGLLGIRKKLVPTRWAITAVHDSLGKLLLEKIRDYPQLNEFHVYFSQYLDNAYHIIFLPQCYSFEQVEAYTASPAFPVVADYEPFSGRKKYADATAGAYYAARFAAAERLDALHRQAAVLVVRTIGSGYSVPLGVWQVFENVRGALMNPPRKFTSLKEVFDLLATESRLPIEKLIASSTTLRLGRAQKKLTEF